MSVFKRIYGYQLKPIQVSDEDGKGKKGADKPKKGGKKELDCKEIVDYL